MANGVTIEAEPVRIATEGDAYLQAARDSGAADADLSLIENLRQRAAEFEMYYQDLLGKGAAIARSGDNAMMQEYGDLIARAETIREKITAATSAIDKAIGWARGTFGSAGMNQLSSLGLVWFLPAAVITAAVAVIGYWVNDYVKFARRFAEQQRIAADLAARGMDPAEANRQAAAAVAETVPGWFGGSGTSKVLLWAALLGVGLMVYRSYRG